MLFIFLMNILTKKCIYFLATVLFLSVFVQNTFADFYKYVDEKGLIHFTNDIESVPERLRSSVKILKEEKEAIKLKLIDGKYVVAEAKAKLIEVKVEAEKLWWRWIVDPISGRTRAPAIMGGYLLISLITLGLIRRHVRGRARKLLLKFLFMGFLAIGLLTYSAHRGHKAYLEYKKSPVDLKNIDLEKLLGVDVESLLGRE